MQQGEAMPKPFERKNSTSTPDLTSFNQALRMDQALHMIPVRRFPLIPDVSVPLVKIEPRRECVVGDKLYFEESKKYRPNVRDPRWSLGFWVKS